MTKLIAISPVFYAGRTRRAGEAFEASPAHAALLLRAGKVEAAVSAQDAAPEPVEAAVRARRPYRRRDMRAEA